MVKHHSYYISQITSFCKVVFLTTLILRVNYQNRKQKYMWKANKNTLSSEYNIHVIGTWMHSFLWSFMVYIPECKQQQELWNNTCRYEIFHTLNIVCGFITLRETCNNQPLRSDMTWLHVTIIYASSFLKNPNNKWSVHKFFKYVQQYTSFSCIWCLTSRSDSYARASSNYSDFLKRHLHLRNRLLDQGYEKIRLIRSLK